MSRLTQGVTNMVKIEYWYDKDTPDNTGWYICSYGSVDDMLAKSPEDVVGPYETETEARRVLAETSDLDKNENTGTSKRKPHDPATDPTPAALNAGIQTDHDLNADDETGVGESVQLELQQTQEL